MKEKLEILKILLDSSKSKMYMFGAMSGGSFAYFIKQDISLLTKSVVGITLVIGVYGFIKNLKKISEIENKLKDINNA